MPNPARILVIDDDPDIRTMLVDLLSSQSTIVTESNAIDAIPPLDWEPFDLLIIDLNMPDLIGEDAIELIRARPAGANLPIIVISADPLVHQRMAGADVQAILPKPFTSAQLQRQVKELLAHPSRGRQLPTNQ